MASYRNISITFWTDSKVDDEFTPEDKYFYLYLLTNPHTNICGCYEISMKQMERETGYNTDTVKRLIKRMQEQHRVIRYCEQTKEVLILNWPKYNWPASDKVKKAILSVAEYIKSDDFRAYVIHTVSIRYGYHMEPYVTETESYTESETEPYTETENINGIADKPLNTPKVKNFQRPTVDEVRAYCQERRNNVDPERFVDHYNSNGWKVGRNAMKDWKAAVRTWERREYSTPQSNTKQKQLAHSSIDMNDVEKLMNPY